MLYLQRNIKKKRKKNNRTVRKLSKKKKKILKSVKNYLKEKSISKIQIKEIATPTKRKK